MTTTPTATATNTPISTLFTALPAQSVQFVKTQKRLFDYLILLHTYYMLIHTY